MYFSSSIYGTERSFWSWNESCLLYLTPMKTAKVTKTIYKKNDAGEVVENGKPSFTVHKNANQYDHSGKQYRDFSKTKQKLETGKLNLKAIEWPSCAITWHRPKGLDILL